MRSLPPVGSLAIRVHPYAVYVATVFGHCIPTMPSPIRCEVALVAAYQELLGGEPAEVPGGEVVRRHRALTMSRGHGYDDAVNLPVRYRQHCLRQYSEMRHQLPVALGRQHRQPRWTVERHLRPAPML